MGNQLTIPAGKSITIPAGKTLNVGGPWSPEYFPLVSWIDFSDASTLTLNGRGISSVTDKISGRVLSQATASMQPVWANGAALFDYTAFMGLAYNGSAFTLPTEYTVLNIIKVASPSSGTTRSISNITPTGSLIEYRSNESIRSLHRFPQGSSGGSSLTIATTDLYNLSTLVARKSSTIFSMHINGVSIDTQGDTTDFSTASFTTDAIGQLNTGVRNFDGYICERVITCCALTTAQLEQYHTYALNKWSILND